MCNKKEETYEIGFTVRSYLNYFYILRSGKQAL